MAIPKHHPVIGQRFSSLTVSSEPFKNGRLRQVHCLCDCGNRKVVTVCKLFSGETKSCGCRHRERARRLGISNATHGHTGKGKRSPTYITWQSMHLRCANPATKSYNRYGGRGIKVAPEWGGKGGFSRFLSDMGERPEGFTLDRIDVDGDYCAANCRWADWATQVANRDRKG